jgi:hypothetical protein
MTFARNSGRPFLPDKEENMRTSTSLRVASGISLLLFAGHTAGGFSSWSPAGSTRALDAMRSFQFAVNGFTRSYWHFYIGFGLVISVYLLAQAVLLWQLASWSRVNPATARPLVAVFFAAAVLTSVLDWMFFFVAPLVMSVATAAVLGLALLPPAAVEQPVTGRP